MKFAQFAVLTLLLSLPYQANAYTKDDAAKVAVSDGSLADTQNAVNYIAARNEDGWVLTVGSPSGSYSWGSKLTITVSHIFTIKGAGTYSPDTRPVITITASGYSGIDINGSPNKTIRVSNFIIKITGSASMAISIGGYGDDVFRIDHCTFQDLPWLYAIRVLEANIANGGKLGPYGLIDHNVFAGKQLFGGVYVFQGSDSNSWKSPMTWGSKQAVYIEDNTFTNTGSVVNGLGAFDGAWGARVVFRHNTLTNWGVVWHGYDTDPVSTLQVEILHNSITTNVDNADTALFDRGGTAYIWDNTISVTGAGHWNSGFKMKYYRCSGGEGVNAGTCCTPACQQQQGRGVVGGVEGTVPVYFYNNRVSGAQSAISNEDPSVILLNTYYFTDQAKPGYAEYTYPHPLVSGSSSTTSAYPSAPLGLTAK